MERLFLKILNIINLNSIIGGQEIYLLNIIKYLKKDYEIYIFTQLLIWKNTELFSYNDIHLIDIENISYKNFFNIKKIILNSATSEDIFIFNGNRAIYLGGLFGLNYKTIAIQHSSLYDIQDGKLKKILRILVYKALLLKYNKLIGISKHTVKPILQYQKVEVILNGIDTSKFYSKNSMPQEHNSKTILMVGTLTDNKGQYEALKVLHYLDDSYKMIIVGDGEDKEHINRYIEKHQLYKRVTLTGNIKNVVDYYSKADILLFMSKNEGLPLTIIEAMACNLPVVTTQAGGIPEIIEDKINGLFITRENTVDIAKIIELVMKDSNFRDLLIDNAYKLVKNKLNLSVHIEKLIKCIEEIK